MIESTERQVRVVLSPREPGQTVDPVLVSRNLSKTYGKKKSVAAVRALQGVDLEFEKARLTAIMGPSGSGKSTLLQCLAGLDRPTEGSVQLSGQEVTSLKPRQLTRLRRDKIGFIFQSPNLVPTLTAQENITLPADIAGRKTAANYVVEIATAMGIADRLTHLPGELSGGQQQRVSCARALLTKPTMVFADEPTGNLDSRASRQVLQYLRQAVDIFEQTIVMVTHDADAAAWADRVIFLEDGVVVGELEDPTRNTVLQALKELGDRNKSAVVGEGFEWIPRLASEGPSLPETGTADEIDAPATSILDTAVPDTDISRPVEDSRGASEESSAAQTPPFEAAVAEVTQISFPMVEEGPAAEEVVKPPTAELESSELPLEAALQKIAPAAALPAEMTRVINQAQQILEELPGSVVEAETKDFLQDETR